MKKIVEVFVFLLLINNGHAQQLSNNYNNKIDSLQSLLIRKNPDTTRLMLLHSLAQVYAYNIQIAKSVETLQIN